MWGMKEVILLKNIYFVIVGNIGFFLMVDIFIICINIKFIYVKCSIRSSFKVLFNW